MGDWFGILPQAPCQLTPIPAYLAADAPAAYYTPPAPDGSRPGEYHVNQTDNTLCLGSPLSLLLKLSKNPRLDGFAENCLVPYLFAISRKLKTGGSFPFGELAHGQAGILSDYAHLFGLKEAKNVGYVLELLGTKKRRANKLLCPCGCPSRLGRCKFNLRLREFRDLASRSWFRKERLGLR